VSERSRDRREKKNELLTSDLEVVGAFVEEGSVDLHEELESVVDHSVDRSDNERKRKDRSQRPIEDERRAGGRRDPKEKNSPVPMSF